MFKAISTLALVFVILASSIGLSVPAQAMGGLSVAPIFPENQNPDTSGFFDLLVSPGERQEIAISVGNATSDDMTVTIHLISASTNRNGIINYTTPGYNDETMRHPFSEIAFLPDAAQGEVVIPVGYQGRVPIFIDIPDEKFEGMILGAIRVIQELSEEDLAAGGTIVNRYSFVLAVRLQHSFENDIEPDFLLGEVGPQLINHRNAIVAHVRHTQPRITRPVTATAQLYARGGTEPLFEADESVNFAPNTIFPFVIARDVGRGLEPGYYTARIQLEYEGQTWNLQHEFEITADTVYEEAQPEAPVDAIDNPPEDDGLLPVWAIIIMVVGGLLIAVVAVMLVNSRKPKQDGAGPHEDGENSSTPEPYEQEPTQQNKDEE